MFRRIMAGLVVVLLASSGVTLGASANAQARIALDRKLPAINFTNVTLRDAIDFLRDVSGANLHVNWKAIEAAGIAADTQINVKLRDVSLRKVLGLVLSEASGGQGLTFYIDDGVIEVTTREVADNVMYTIVYPVQDLLFEPPTFTEPPDFVLPSYGGGGGNNGGSGSSRSSRGNNSYGGSGGGGGYGGGSNGMFGQVNSNNGYSNSAAQPKDPNAKAQELIDLIVETVEPASWQQNGGKATIKYFSGNLVVTAPRSVHEMIGGPID